MKRYLIAALLVLGLAMQAWAIPPSPYLQNTGIVTVINGVQQIPYSASNKIPATYLSGIRSVTSTTTGTATALTAANSGGIFDNAGATGDVTYPLPAAGAAYEGVTYTFRAKSTSYNLIIDPGAGKVFAGLFTTTAGQKLKCDKVDGSTVTITCEKNDAGTYVWYISPGHGAWTGV